MATGPTEDKPDGEDEKNPWKARTAALVIVGMFGLVAYVTVRTGQIPANVAWPLIAAAAFGLWAFDLNDFRGGKK
jgi:hypothetical protein